MKYQKLYPQDWVDRHPYKHADEVDKYYTNVANKVSKIISESQLHNYDIMGDITPLAMYLTLWFEDIISGTNVWKTVNTICQQRYGSKLPFYDTTEYYDGEPNEQDIRLLIWHYLQTYNENDQVFNPENLGITELSKLICAYFDECYPDTPENERLATFYFNPSIATDYWECRKVVEWFTLHSYIMVFGLEELLYEAQNVVAETSHPFDLSQVMYSIHMEKSYRKQRTLLSLTPAEWLWHIRGCQEEGLANMRMSDMRHLEVIEKDSEKLYVKDLVTDEEFGIELDSWTDNAEIVKMSKKGLGFIATTMPFGSKTYHCGFLSIPPKMDLDKVKQIRLNIEFTEKLHAQFLKLSKGECLVFFSNLAEFKKIIGNLGLKDSTTSFGLNRGAVHCSDVDGMFIVNDVECLKTPLNPHYNQSVARERGHLFFTAPNTVPYHLTCAIQEAGWLEDAHITSLIGEEYGRKFLQQHRMFITDYFYAQHR